MALSREISAENAPSAPVCPLRCQKCSLYHAVRRLMNHRPGAMTLLRDSYRNIRARLDAKEENG